MNSQSNQNPIGWISSYALRSLQTLSPQGWIETSIRLTPEAEDIPLFAVPVASPAVIEQESVGWQYRLKGDRRWINTTQKPESTHPEFELRPIYAAPVPQQELTDEEIIAVRHQLGHLRDPKYDAHYIQFARAILAAKKSDQ